MQVSVAGSAIKWLRDGLNIIDDVQHFNALASLCEDTGGLYFVTALSGLLAPYWDPGAAGLMIGALTLLQNYEPDRRFTVLVSFLRDVRLDFVYNPCPYRESDHGSSCVPYAGGRGRYEGRCQHGAEAFKGGRLFLERLSGGMDVLKKLDAT